MTVFNKKENSQKTKNFAGGEAYKLTPESELYSLVVTSLFADKYYESNSDQITRLRALLKKVSPEFVAKLAVYARESMYLRTMPVVLTIELAKIHNGDDLVSKTLARVVARADEITETLAYYIVANDRKDVKKLGKLSKQVQKGLSEAFNRFDEYQFAKYDRETAVSLRDALFIVHPKAKNSEQQEIFNRIVSGTLKTPYTWETQLSERGNTKEVWEELIDSGKLGYMALLRNLRNILKSGISSTHVANVAKRLSNPDEVRKSKQLPFRFFAAYREIAKEIDSGYSSMILEALESAVLVSVDSIEGFDFDTRVLIATDVSGSMVDRISPKSSIMRVDIGLILSMLMQNKCKNMITGIFGTEWKRKVMPKNQVLSNSMESSRYSSEVGWSTNGHLIMKDLIDSGTVVDKVMIFTDMQLWNSTGWGQEPVAKYWHIYKKIAPDAKLYLFDLAGYGTTPVSEYEKGVYLISGFSDKIFGILEALDNAESAVKIVENMKI